MTDSLRAHSPEPDLIESLAAGDLEGAQRRRAERLIIDVPAARAYYKALTRARYPEIPNYTIVEQVGKGGFGVVYKAIHEEKERVEALKVLFSKKPQLTSFFQNEVHVIAKLRHPNIATLFEAELREPPLYYTMEYVAGERLNDYLTGRKPQLSERLQLFRKIAVAVDYAHEQDVLHRDIKPQNVLIDAQDEPHLVDFGIATRLAMLEGAAQGPQSSAPVGTVGFIPPEQRAGAMPDRRADIFALGALLFYCVTGESARFATDANRRFEMLHRQRLNQPHDLSAIIGRCVATRPEDRYETCAALIADLDNYVAGRAVRAPRKRQWFGDWVRIGLYVVRQYPAPAGTATLAFSAMLIAGIFYFLQAHVLVAGVGRDQTMLIKFTPETIEAIRERRIGADLPGLSSNDGKSWRMLHGRLLERLAEAKPLVVAWDYYFPDPQPQFDPYLLEGVRKLHTPVVFGTKEINLNSEPSAFDRLRDPSAGVYSFGILYGVPAQYLQHEYEVTYAIKRGFEDPVPSISVAAFAATRYPEAEPRLVLNRGRKQIEIQYRRRKQDNANEPRWEQDSHILNLQQVVAVNAESAAQIPGVLEGDIVANARVRPNPEGYWGERAIPYEEVLLASTTQLQRWFDGKAVLVGQMIPGQDQHMVLGNRWIYGCTIHAEALDQLLSNQTHRRLPPQQLALRAILWSGAAALFVLARPRRQWQAIRRVAAIGGAVFALAVVIAVFTALRVVQLTWLELSMAICHLLAAGSGLFVLRAVRERQQQLAPAALPTAETPTELDSTVLAETRVATDTAARTVQT